MKAVFLDRDGVINNNRRPVNKPRDLILYDWTVEALQILKDLGYTLFVVTNQGGISAGYFTEQDLSAIHTKLMDSTDNLLTEICHCPHLGDNCECRKPKSGMIDTLVAKYDIDISNSFMIGDRDVDIMAGNTAGVRTIKLGKSYYLANYRVDTLLEAARLIKTLT